MIKIKTEKVIVGGKKFVKIIAVDLLGKSALPSEYTDQGKRCYKKKFNDRSGIESSNCTSYSRWLMTEEGVYTPKQIADRLEFIRQCGNRLRKINTRLKKENADWHGVQTLCI